MNISRTGILAARSLFAFLCVAAAFVPAPARASILFEVLDTNVSPGSSGSLDVVLRNDGLSTQNILVFTVEIGTANTNITFVGANESTITTYIFAGDSFDEAFAFPFFSLSNAQKVDASDLSNSGAGSDVSAGATFGLAHVLFDVAPDTPLGPMNVSISDFPLTGLSDSNGNAVPFTVQQGTINVVPEPGSLTMVALGILLAGLIFRTDSVRDAGRWG